MQAPVLTAALASRFARLALGNVRTEYPNKPDHVLASPGDLRASRELHPSFYGSYDWHSCVHMHWLLARLRRLHPSLPERGDIAAVFDDHLAEDAVAAECAYLARPQAKSFERTYGWAWLLELARELGQGDDHGARRWARAQSRRSRTPSPRVTSTTCRAPVTRSATGCTRTRRSASRSRSTTRARRAPPYSRTRASRARWRGSRPTATCRPHGSPRARTSCRPR
jgi:hypothetical protein